MYNISGIFSAIISPAFILLERLFGDWRIIIPITTLALSLKTYIMFNLSRNKPSTRTLKISWVLLLIVLSGAMIEDFAWLFRSLHYSVLPSLDYRIVRLIIRFAWLMQAIRYISFSLFLENSATISYKIGLRQKIFLLVCVGCSLFFFILMIKDFNCNHQITIMAEILMLRLQPLFLSLILMPSSLWYTAKQIRSSKTPRILIHQFKILIALLVVPDIIMNFIEAFPFNFCLTSITLVVASHTISCMSNALLTFMLYYCARKMVTLRFLNIKNHVQSTKKFNFIDDFKDVLEKLGQATTMPEITYITQSVFQKAFSIPSQATSLHSCNQQTGLEKNPITATIGVILSPDNKELSNAIYKRKILIYDEIAFNNFYEQDAESSAILSLMDNAKADICVPIYNQRKMVACIIVERGARRELYGNVERDEMIVFSQYLGNIINLLQNRNLENIYASEKEMREELFSKHQEINQYKESMRSFLNNNKHSRIGIVFYKNRQFVFGNHEAQDMVDINLNVQIAHPLAKACKKVVADVTQYQTTQTAIATDDDGHTIVVNGMPYLERTHVILILYYPEATDLICKQLNQLKDPSAWDYLLYLQTTQTGRVINKLIPGTGAHILNFKIDLLKTALSTKATLLDMPSEDLVPTVELLHHISLRSQLHTIQLDHPQTTADFTMKLFGINPLFGIKDVEPLIKKLDTTGTLFIQNIHFLNIETQEYLAEYIHYGFFKIYKSDQKVFSNTRILASSNQSLEQLTLEGKFSPLLLKELQKTTLVMPTLNMLQEDEIAELANGFFQQALADKTFEKILEFDKRDLKRILDLRPNSLLELKKMIQSSLVQKSRTNHIDTEKTIDTGYMVADPELVEIARLGKYALKDEKAMTILWNKFKNQNKIATFLGVNRSSVNRRCKDYNLIGY